MKYLEVKISAEDQESVDKILNSLLEKKLMTGGQIIRAPARFLWKGQITDMDYFNITGFTLEEKKGEIIEDVVKNSTEEVPMIAFTEFHGNLELLEWIEETLKLN